jgi:hypothetical protein
MRLILVGRSVHELMELTLIEPYYSTEHGQLQVAHCVPKHWQSRSRLHFRFVKSVEALTIK